MRALLFALALFGCASGSELDEPRLMGPFVLHESEPCGMTFDPVPELLDATERAAERWSKATGCDVRVEAGGVPVVLVQELLTTSGKRAAGAWRHTDGSDVCERIDIDAALGGAQTMAHEMGHCLGARGHSSSGIMAEGAPGDIDSPSLELVCQSLACAVFSPEAP